jgi:hypothetical protein
MADHQTLPPDITRSLRALAHDLSNALETIMQACYLLGQGPLREEDRKWLDLIDNASQDAARINRAIREVLRGEGGSEK